MAVKLSATEALSMRAHGSIGRLWDVSAAEFEMQGRVTQPEVLHWLFSHAPIPVERLHVKAHLSKDSGPLRIEAFSAEAGGRSGLELESRGSATLTNLGSSKGLSDLAVSIRARANDSSPIKGLLPGLPVIGPVSVQAELTGSSTRTKIAIEVLEAGERSSLHLKAKGGFDIRQTESGLDLVSVDMKVRTHAADTQRLGQLFKRRWPELGSFSGEFRLKGESPKIAATEIEALVQNGKKWRIEASGAIGDVFSMLKSGPQGLAADLSVSAHSLAALGQALELSVPPLGAVRGKGRLAQRGGRLRLDDLNLEVAKEGYLTLTASGSLDDVLRGDKFDVTLGLDSNDPQKAAALLGQDIGKLPSLRGAGQITGGLEHLRFGGTLTLGGTTFNLDLSGGRAQGRPRLNGTIKAATLHLADLGIAPSRGHGGGDAPRQVSTPKHRTPLFSKEAFDTSALHGVDGSLIVRFDEVIGAGLSIKSADATIGLERGRLRIRPAKLVFENGAVSVDFDLNATKTPSALLKVTAQDVGVAPTLAQFQSEVSVEGGRLSTVVDLKTRSTSPHELAANLNGRLGLAVEHARVPRKTLDRLVIGLFQWTIHGVVNEKRSAPVDCALVHATAKNGTIAIDELYATGPY